MKTGICIDIDPWWHLTVNEGQPRWLLCPSWFSGSAASHGKLSINQSIKKWKVNQTSNTSVIQHNYPVSCYEIKGGKTQYVSKLNCFKIWFIFCQNHREKGIQRFQQSGRVFLCYNASTQWPLQVIWPLGTLLSTNCNFSQSKLSTNHRCLIVNVNVNLSSIIRANGQ